LLGPSVNDGRDRDRMDLLECSLDRLGEIPPGLERATAGLGLSLIVSVFQGHVRSLRNVEALDLFQLTFAQGFNFHGEATFCFCTLFRFCVSLAANGLQLSQGLHMLFALTTCLCFNLLLSFILDLNQFILSCFGILNGGSL